MNKDSIILVTGANGLLGSAIIKELNSQGYKNIITVEKENNKHEYDLLHEYEVKLLLHRIKPEYIFNCAAKVGGIKANIEFPAEFIYKNLMINSNIIHNSYLYKVKKLINFGSSCIYPTETEVPIKEEYLLTGKLESTNEAYAIAKIAGLKMCDAYNKQYKTNFYTLMCSNLYGINDQFDLNNSHVLPALIRRFYENKEKESITIWGTGKPIREFTYAEDIAKLSIDFMNNYNAEDMSESFINIGSNETVSIYELALILKEITKFNGELVFDTSKPDGMKEKFMDYTKFKELYKKDFKFTCLIDGLIEVYNWFQENYNKGIIRL